MQTSDRLTLFTTSLAGGGAERIMVMLANAFSRRGLAVDLVLCRAQGPYLEDVPANVRIIDLQAPRIARALPGFVRYLRRERPASVLSFLTAANCLALLARKMAGTDTRIVVSERSYLRLMLREAQWHKARVLTMLVRRLYPSADAVVGISQGIGDSLRRDIGLTALHVHTIHNPLDFERVVSAAALPTGHPWLAADQPPVLLGAGRLTRLKDFETLIRAFAHLRPRRESRLVILGEGEQRPALEALARDLGLTDDQLAMPGFSDNPWQWMSRAAVFALTSRHEGFGNVIVEALACGTPVVSTDCPSGPSEILDRGKYGRLVPVGDVESLSDAILQTLDDIPDRETLKNRARHFSIDRAADRYLNLLFPERTPR
jgi:glycosyltransferase involved in cell wall biosynthesis